MKNIYIDTQDTHNRFVNDLVPFVPEPGEEEEVWEWYDRWLDWLIDLPCLHGDDGEYEYPYSKQAIERLEMFKVKYEVRGDEAE